MRPAVYDGRKELASLLFWIIALVIVLIATNGCPPDDDDPSTSSGQADDDATPIDDDTVDDDTIDDDDTVDDDTIDDDTGDDDSVDDDTIDDDTGDDDTVDDDTIDDDTVDDDTVDDDTIDDDTVDDDTIDDDTIDDDTIDDDTIDDDTVDDDTTDDDSIDDDSVDDDSVDDDIVMVEGDVEFVDGPPPGFATTRMVIDNAGTIYLLAQQSRDLFLYTSTDGDTWNVEHVIGFADDPDLAVDDEDHLHLAYKTLRGNDLVYGTNATGEWQFETVDAEGDTGAYASIAVDAAGRVRLAYYNQTHGNLNYAVSTAGGWQVERVDKSENVGKDASLAIDYRGYAHIFYRDSAAPSVKYATNKSGDWVTVVIEETPSDSGQVSIGVLGDGSVYACYYYSLDDGLRIVTNRNGEWEFVITDTDYEYMYFGVYNSLAVAPDDTVWIGISYYFNGYDYMSSAMRVLTLNGAPIYSSVESFTRHFADPYHYFTMLGNNNAIAVDPAGRPHVVYGYSNPEFGLRHGVYNSVTWEKSFVATGNNSCSETSLALGPDGAAHISYTGDNWGYTNLMYATDETGVWVPELWYQGDYSYVFHDIHQTTYGKYNSIAVSTNGAPSVAFQYHYYHREGKSSPDAPEYIENHIYHLRINGGWLDEIGCSYSSIALNSTNGYHVAYYRSPISGPYKNEAKAIDLLITNGYGNYEVAATDSYRLTAIDIDDEDYLHVAYENIDGLVRYATNRSGAWVSETVADVGDAGDRISLNVDASGAVHVSFGGGNDGPLLYAANATGSWVVETVDERNDAGRYSSLAVKSDGTVIIAYYDETSNRVRLASNETGAWSSFAVDRGGYYVSLALDDSEDIHLAYPSGGAVYHTLLSLP